MAVEHVADRIYIRYSRNQIQHARAQGYFGGRPDVEDASSGADRCGEKRGAEKREADISLVFEHDLFQSEAGDG